MVWYGMVEVCEGAPVAVSGWVLTDRHDVRPCAASSLSGKYPLVVCSGVETPHRIITVIFLVYGMTHLI